jgi:ATPase family associated with various cellular activities (AAA)/Winged helix domain, variant
MTTRLQAQLRVDPQTSWADRNQQWLSAAIARLRERFEAKLADGTPGGVQDCVDVTLDQGFTPALLRCSQVFGLTPFERELLLLTAGLELDQSLRSLVSLLNGGNSSAATFGLALGVLTQPHWDALGPDAPLRHWRLIEVQEGSPLALAPLGIDERVLHFITGVAAGEARLLGIAGAIRAPTRTHELVDDLLAARIADALGRTEERGPIIVLQADPPDFAALRDLALAAASRRGSSVLWISAHTLPADPGEAAEVARRVDREAALEDSIPLLWLDGHSSELSASSFADKMRSPLIWIGPSSSSLSALPRPRSIVRFHLPPAEPTLLSAALLARGKQVLPALHDDDDTSAAIERAATQFRLEVSTFDEIMSGIAALDSSERSRAVWNAAREAARGGLELLAQRIVTSATLDDLVLPPPQLAALHDITRHLRHRDRVYRAWGFGDKHKRGQGLTALFVGESGTGKTLAAEAIANEVELDLYRVDLATVVSKYIGETEKNLKRVFDAAEASGAVLLFDEADALFGKRSEVRDSHDRYANIEIAYLLQRVESYRGLAILTTNMKSAVDRAFLRRIRFVVHFPFPDAAAREQIWRRQFPARAPLGEIDYPALARLNLAGGHINSIAIGAAFNAADGSGRIDRAALMAAARAEFAKLERSFNGALAGEGA